MKLNLKSLALCAAMLSFGFADNNFNNANVEEAQENEIGITFPLNTAWTGLTVNSCEFYSLPYEARFFDLDATYNDLRIYHETPTTCPSIPCLSPYHYNINQIVFNITKDGLDKDNELIVEYNNNKDLDTVKITKNGKIFTFTMDYCYVSPYIKRNIENKPEQIQGPAYFINSEMMISCEEILYISRTLFHVISDIYEKSYKVAEKQHWRHLKEASERGIFQDSSSSDDEWYDSYLKQN